MKLGTSLLAAGIVIAGVQFSFAEAVGPDAVKFEDGKVAASLTGAAGDPAKGAEVFVSRKLGNCLACHANKDREKDLFHGNVGPELDGVADRWSAEELRAIVINSKKVINEESVMPSFYSLEVGEDVAEKFVGKTILSAEQVEDVVAYLTTLKE